MFDPLAFPTLIVQVLVAELLPQIVRSRVFVPGLVFLLMGTYVKWFHANEYTCANLFFQMNNTIFKYDRNTIFEVMNANMLGAEEVAQTTKATGSDTVHPEHHVEPAAPAKEPPESKEKAQFLTVGAKMLGFKKGEMVEIVARAKGDISKLWWSKLSKADQNEIKMAIENHKARKMKARAKTNKVSPHGAAKRQFFTKDGKKLCPRTPRI